MEKTVTLSKVEYDRMEQELKDLKAIIGSRTITRILYPNYAFNKWANLQIGTEVQYVSGTEDNQEVIEEFKKEIEKLTKELSEYQSNWFKRGTRIYELEAELDRLKEKNKPWYKFWS